MLTTLGKVFHRDVTAAALQVVGLKIGPGQYLDAI